jgi:hypothetical protein
MKQAVTVTVAWPVIMPSMLQVMAYLPRSTMTSAASVPVLASGLR